MFFFAVLKLGALFNHSQVGAKMSMR